MNGDPRPANAVVGACRRLAANERFDQAILVVIVLNALVLALDTYEQLSREHGATLSLLNDVFLGVFVVELAIRMTAAWPSPRRFFANGWNTFDFIIVTSAFLPGLRENATLLRMLRLARIVRAVRLLPDLRVLIVAVARSVPGVASLAMMTVLLIYLYGMVGWLIFDDHDPEHFGDIGKAMLSMFVLLTLEDFPRFIDFGRELSDWTVVYFVSYVLIASFLIFNLFIGVVINSLEEARGIEHRRERAADRAAAEASGDATDDAIVDVRDRIDELRTALEALDGDLHALTHPPPGGRP